MAVQRGYEFAACATQLEKGDVAGVVADKAMLRRCIIHQVGRRRRDQIRADASSIVRRVEGEVLVATSAQHPVVLQRIIYICYSRFVRYSNVMHS